MRRNYSQSGGIHWKIFSVFTALVLAVIGGFLVVSNWRILGKTLDSIKYRQAAEANLKAVSNREVELSGKLKELETDTGLDKEIRNRFPVAMPLLRAAQNQPSLSCPSGKDGKFLVTVILS